MRMDPAPWAIESVSFFLRRTAHGITDPTSPFGVGSGATYHMVLSSENGFDSPTIVMSCGEKVRFHLIAGRAEWPLVGTVWQHTETNSEFYAATLQFLNDSTPEGAHWVLTERDGGQYWFERHSPNRLVRYADRFGNAVTYSYDGGLLSRITSPHGRTISFTYNSDNHVVGVTDNTGRTVTYEYRENLGDVGNVSYALLTGVNYPDNTSEHYTYATYSLNGLELKTAKIKTMTNRRGIVWVKNQWDGWAQRVINQTYADGATLSFSYLGSDNQPLPPSVPAASVAIVTDAKGNQERIEFAGQSHYASKIIRAYGSDIAQSTSYSRTSGGLITEVVDDRQRKTTYQYDGSGNPIALTRLSGTDVATTVMREYEENLVSKITTEGNLKRTFSYTGGCIASTTKPDGQTETYTCNSEGQVDSVTDSAGSTRRFKYVGGDLKNAIDANGGVTTLVSDALGRTTAITAPDGSVEIVAYDMNDRPVSYTDGQGGTTRVTYDGNGNTTNVLLPNGSSLSYEYDSMDRLIARHDAVGNVERTTYDSAGLLDSITDRKGQVTTFSYDALSRPVLVTYADGSGVQARYDNGNRMISMLDSVSGELAWTYDEMDRLTSETSSSGVVRNVFDNQGRRTRVAIDGGDFIDYTYDDVNRMNSIIYKDGEFDFHYNVAGRRDSLSFPNRMTASYQYDAKGLLSHQSYKLDNNATLWSVKYSYDPNGRRTSEVMGDGSASTLLDKPTISGSTFDGSNRILSSDGASFEYDKNGNLVDDGRHKFQWDARNRLVSIEESGIVVASFSYDALGRRTGKTVGANSTTYLLDGQSILRASEGARSTTFIDGPLLDEHLAAVNSESRFYIGDDRHSIAGLVSQSGNLEDKFAFSAYGSSSADLTPAASYGFTGRESDVDDIYYFRARYYSASLRRFIGEDPLGFGGGGSNFYAYANGDPISLVDPLGLRPLTDCEKRVLAPYIPKVDLDNADIHDGHVPWYLPDGMDGITRGDDIYFRDGAYPYGTAEGFRILSHELIHVGQYRDGMTWMSYFWSVKGGYAENSKYERPAYDMGAKVYNDLSGKKSPCDCNEGSL